MMWMDMGKLLLMVCESNVVITTAVFSYTVIMQRLKDFNCYSASHSLSAMAELLVCYILIFMH